MSICKDLLNIWYVPNQFKTQEMRNREVQSDQFVTQKMWDEAVKKSPEVFRLVPEHLKTQEMCNEAVQSNP